VPSFAEPAIKFPASLKILRAGLMPAREIITHTFRLGEHEPIFKGIIEADQPIIKAVCTPHA